MSQPRLVFENGLYNGRPLRDWVGPVVEDIVRACDPLEVILFGSLARGDEGPDSDIDLLVVLPEVPAERRVDVTAEIHAAITVPVPVSVLVTDPTEVARRGHLRGWVLYAALHGEGVVVYERAA